MASPAPNPGGDEIGTGRWRVAFAIFSVVLALGLLAAAFVNVRTEWRATQTRHVELSKASGAPPIAVKIRQLWRPQLGVIDRCISCHVSMGDAPAIAGDPLFMEHPPVAHDPREFGCTVCHGGQGLATTRDAAHGRVPHWDEPLLDRGQFEAGCGSCHPAIRVPSAESARQGATLFDGYGCRDCHKGARDLASAGLRPRARDWHDRHVGMREGDIVFAALADDELPAMEAFLDTQVGAPKLMAGKQLAHELGCRGCHRLNGVGGDDGPDLTAIGAVPESESELAAVTGERTAFNFHVQHLLDPARVTAGSQMLNLHLTKEQAESLALYVLSLRPRSVPDSLFTRDRLQLRLGLREFATDGRSLYAAFCAACHGPSGEGRAFEDSKAPFTALASPEFLALADDAFLRRTIHEGRPGSRMPSWGTKEGGLRADEIDALVLRIRAFEKPAPDFAAVAAATPDLEAGRTRFTSDCAPCHGAEGQGTVVAPPLAARDNEVTIDDNRLYGTLANGIAGTAMGTFRTFDAPTLKSIIATVKALPRLDVVRKGWSATTGDPARGGALYVTHCAKCHGQKREGEKGPALANAAFLATASNGFLAGTILRGRSGTKMPAFGAKGLENEALTADMVADVIAFLRSPAVAPVAETSR